MELYEAQAIAEAYESGLSLEKTALKFFGNRGSMNRVREALRMAGVKVRPRGSMVRGPVDSGRLADLIAMRNDGATLDQMGAKYRISRERVRQVLTAAGIDTSTEARPLTPQERRLVEEYVYGNDNLYYYVEKAGVSIHVFRRWMLKMGHLPKRGGRHIKSREVMERAKRVASLYKKGVSAPAIAKEVGLPHATAVYRDLARAGVKPNRSK